MKKAPLGAYFDGGFGSGIQWVIPGMLSKKSPSSHVILLFKNAIRISPAYVHAIT